MALIKTRTLRLFVGGLAVIAGAALVWFVSHLVREQRMSSRTDGYVREMISMLDLPAMSDFHRRLDAVRMFINDNSRHQMDQAFWSARGNPAAYALAVLSHAKRLSPEPAHMECSTRSNLMARLLQGVGYKTRIVAVFNSRTNLHSHSFLEVMNPETSAWETQDPTYDIYWRSKETGARVSLAEAAEDIEQIEPCGRERCGWDHVSREGIEAKELRFYLHFISITDKQREIRYTLHTSRAYLDRVYMKGRKRGRFCEVQAKRCKHGFYDIKEFDFAAEVPR